jgi:hypothetical protein
MVVLSVMDAARDLAPATGSVRMTLGVLPMVGKARGRPGMRPASRDDQLSHGVRMPILKRQAAFLHFLLRSGPGGQGGRIPRIVQGYLLAAVGAVRRTVCARFLRWYRPGSRQLSPRCGWRNSHGPKFKAMQSTWRRMPLDH